ncbi:hypothetical protein BDV37DRAFT_16886 [Aspergillus pseudonomiae]|uniref:Uncharacterized protein n=1 Tax=Aspergillus pseudonomiae TaxID=1506151 RepID=A0A5N7CZA9_9EURO|nr:uncharacterized protein BDV37DRAFT_16886 [Aspergillus pseudonomiae]KAE8398923.1 hypothetical protein BDV37DRAFT_16886 [Aspergillus pseudonomiae]
MWVGHLPRLPTLNPSGIRLSRVTHPCQLEKKEALTRCGRSPRSRGPQAETNRRKNTKTEFEAHNKLC